MEVRFRQMSVPILLGAGILILILRMVQDFPHVWMNLFLAFLWIGIFCWRNMFLREGGREKAFPLLCAAELMLSFSMGFFGNDTGILFLLLITSADCLIQTGPRPGIFLFPASAGLSAVLHHLSQPDQLRQTVIDVAQEIPLILFLGLISYLLYYALDSHRKMEAALAEKAQRDIALTAAYSALEKANRSIEEVAILRERNRIARDIHDTVGHTITSIIVEAEAGNMLLSTEPQAAREKYAMARGQAVKALAEIRSSVRLLTGDSDRTPEQMLTEIIDELQVHTGVVVRKDIVLPPSVGDDQLHLIARILREGLSNGIRHGKASAFYFTLRPAEGKIVCIVQDNGRGTRNLRKGFGLKQMERSVLEIGGQIFFQSDIDEGFEIRAELPLLFERIVTEENRIGWPVREPLRVVGLFSGKGMMAFAEGDQEVIQQNTSVVLCYPREGRAIMNEFLETTFGSRYELVTYERISDVIDESRDAIGGITIFIGIVIVITLITLLSNILLTQYAQREKELQLLFALGYTKRRIAFSVFREIGAANMTGYIAGILLGVVVAWLTNICLIMDKAFYLELFDPLMVIGVSLIPVVVTCMCILAPLRYVREDTQL